MKNAQTSAFTIDSTESITAPMNWGTFWSGVGLGIGITVAWLA